MRLAIDEVRSGQSATMIPQGEIGLKKRILLALLCLAVMCVLFVEGGEGARVKAAVPTGASTVGQVPGDYDVVRTEYRIRAGMHVSFRRFIGKASTSSKWQVTVQSAQYPKEIEISWVWPRSDGTTPVPTLRKLTGLERGRTFGPLYGGNDPEQTDWTAPWLSREVLRELRTGKVAYNFKMEPSASLGFLQGICEWKERLCIPLNSMADRCIFRHINAAKDRWWYGTISRTLWCWNISLSGFRW